MVRRLAPVLAPGRAGVGRARGRGLAAALAVLLAGAYLVVAGELPEVGGDGGRLLAGALGALAVAACALCVLPGRDEPAGLAILGMGGAVLAVTLAGAGVGPQAAPVEALLAAAAGLLFAIAFDLPAAVVAVPLLVAGVDLASLLGGGPDPLVRAGDKPDVLTLDLPRWGGGSVAAIGLLDVVFLALFAAWALRYGIRPRLATALMAAGLAASVLLGVALDEAIPALPFVAAGLLVPALPRVPSLLRGEGYGAGMDLEEKTLDPAVPDRCQVCGAQLIPSEQQAVLESGSPPLCSIHAAEDVPLEDEQETEDR